MASSSIRKHASTGPASDQPAVPEPAFAERARTLMYLGRIGSLSTLSRAVTNTPAVPLSLILRERPRIVARSSGVVTWSSVSIS